MEFNMNDVKYVFTVIGGCWSYIHELFIILNNDDVLYTTEFENDNILNCEIQKKYNLYKLNDKPENIRISTSYRWDKNGNAIKKEIYLDSLLKNGKVNFEKIVKNGFCMDAPDYTLYKNKNNQLKKILKTTDIKACPGIYYVCSLKNSSPDS